MSTLPKVAAHVLAYLARHRGRFATVIPPEIRGVLLEQDLIVKAESPTGYGSEQWHRVTLRGKRAVLKWGIDGRLHAIRGAWHLAALKSGTHRLVDWAIIADADTAPFRPVRRIEISIQDWRHIRSHLAEAVL